MFIPAYVLVWRGNSPEKRVRDAVHGDHYALNTNRMFEITENYNGDPTMFFYDNPADVKDSGARMTITDETIASIIAYADLDHGSESVTLSVFPDNDITATPTDITLPKACIAYLWEHLETSGDYTWLVYANDGWEMKKVIVDEDYSTLWNRLNTV
jgi:hypothetical protein